MPRQIRGFSSAVLVLALLSIQSSAQQVTVTHALSLAEVTYGQEIAAIARDPSGDVWFGGQTCSMTLPTTPGAIQPAAGTDGCHGMLGRMKPDGTVGYLSYFGGTALSSVTALTLDGSGNLFVGGWTYSPDFPTTPGAYDRVCGADGTCTLTRYWGVAGRVMNQPVADGFVSKLTPAADRYVFSTYLGGSDSDSVAAIAVDGQGRVHVAGATMSSDFPVTAGALQSSFSPGVDPDGDPLDDGFYVRLSADGASLQYGTYMGGLGSDWATAVAVDANGDGYVTGTTMSTDFPIVNGAQGQNTSSAQSLDTASDAFLARFGAGNAVFSTYVGGSDTDAANGLAVVGNDIYLAGQACSKDFPGLASANTGCNGFISLASPLNGQVTQTYLLQAPNALIRIQALSVNANRVAYVTGLTEYTNLLPTTPDAYQRASGGVQDAFMSIVDLGNAEGPMLLYSTYLGGTMEDNGLALTTDASGGAYVAGYTRLQFPGASPSFPSVNGQAPPAPESNAADFPKQSFVAHVAPSPASVQSGGPDLVLYARDATAVAGNWQFVTDSTAARGTRIWDAETDVPKVATPAADPSNYFELTFQAPAGVPYHLWLHMKADFDSYQHDSVWVQFSDSVGPSGKPIWRTHSTDGTPVVLEDCSGCGDHGWGWNDNGYGVPGTAVVFASSGPHTIRVQQREDGVSIDQVVLSSSQWLNASPGVNGGSPFPPPAIDGSPGPLRGWRDADVGATGAKGSAAAAPGGTVTLQGGGADVWGTADAFNYLYTPLSADGTIIARVTAVSDQANWVKAGLMIRGSLDPASAQAFILVSHAKGVAFQRRTTDGGSSVSTSGTLSSAPHWVKLVRTGNTIAGYESADGSTWTLVGSDTFSLPGSAYVGLAVSSHVSGTLATAVFDSLSISPTVGWGDADVGSASGSSSLAADGTSTVTGWGTDIWGTADAFHYRYQLLEGDGTIVARVASIQNVDPWVKAGVMIRETLDRSSAHAFLLVSAAKGVAFQRRETAIFGGASVNTAGSTSTAPHWVKLTRSGDTFTAFESPDGTNWTLVGTDTIPMTTSVYIGLAVTSHSVSASASCTFDHVSIQ